VQCPTTVDVTWTRCRKPQLVVIDDFLTPSALEELHRYCAGSTMWRRVYDAGYGATPEDGLVCPLMAQIVEETQRSFRQIMGSPGFLYLGAFIYDSGLCAGTNIHADNAAVKVNFYIAPDDANLDPQSGGLDVWDVAITSQRQMRQLYADEAAARAFLENSNAKMTRIAHRANRRSPSSQTRATERANSTSPMATGTGESMFRCCSEEALRKLNGASWPAAKPAGFHPASPNRN